MKQLLLSLLFFTSLLASNNDINSTLQEQLKAKLLLEKENARIEKIDSYLKELFFLESEIVKEKVWMKSYSSYLTSIDVRNTLSEMRKRIKYLQKKGKTQADKDELNSLVSKEIILATQVDQLKEKDSALFSQLLTPPVVGEIPPITNPFDIFTGISLIKTFDEYLNEYIQRKKKLTELISLIREENKIYKSILELDNEGKYTKEAKDKEKQLERFEIALDTIVVTAEVYEKRLDVLAIKVNKAVEVQVYRLVKIGIIILIILFIFFLLKLFVKKYITDNERFYMANKVITFTNVTVILIVLFFNYIENASYIVTILGFASAGIAIAMKDWFMSILGWLVIVFGGSIHVGDRIRVVMDGHEYVGDVMDISLLRMTVFEDVTLTTHMVNRRAGRIIFVPNNYIFTRMIANYSHSSLKTVWDGIDIVITFDSNHKKAMHICKEIARKYSKGYTDITRKQLNKLRSHYSLKNTNVEPRIFSFAVENGVSISTWYLTNAYATLTLRSVISVDIVEAFNEADDIQIAYPTQKLHLESEKREKPFDDGEMV